jgi:glutamate--cysteine ligase
VIAPGERPLHALRERGVEYVEVRCMDLDPFEPVGINAQTMRFLDVFLLHCLLSESPPDTPQEIAELARNQHRVAERGREPGLALERGAREVALADWGAEVLEQCAPAAQALDAAHGGTHYRAALAAARRVLGDMEQTPSARVLAAMREDFEGSYVGFTRAQSLQTRNALLALPFAPELARRFEAMAQASLEDQKRLEAADTLPFESYRQAYLSSERLAV